jgi:putative transposase
MKNNRNPAKLRKEHRLSPAKYKEAGSYFLTSCCFDHLTLFGKVQIGQYIELNKIGRMVEKWWLQLPGKFKLIELGEFVVMPNHFHGIIRIMVGADAFVRPYGGADAFVRPYESDHVVTGGIDPRVDPSISRIMQWFKTMSTFEYYRMQKSSGTGNRQKLWQRSYWDHIIRNEADDKRISDYIKNNPTVWIADRFHRLP